MPNKAAEPKREQQKKVSKQPTAKDKQMQGAEREEKVESDTTAKEQTETKEDKKEVATETKHAEETKDSGRATERMELETAASELSPKTERDVRWVVSTFLERTKPGSHVTLLQGHSKWDSAMVHQASNRIGKLQHWFFCL